MAGYKLPSISVTLEESKGLLNIDESVTKYCIPVVSNTILIKNCQAKVLGDSFTPWSELSNEMFFDAVGKCESNPFKLVQTEVCEAIPRLDRIESEMIDLDYYYSSDSSSDGAISVPDDNADNSSALVTTLRLLEEVTCRILGEKTLTVPKIEKVVVSCTNSANTDEEKSEEKSSDEEEDEETEKYGEYLDRVKYSEMFVDGILKSAKQVCKYQHEKKIVCVTFTESQRMHDITWPTIEHFSVERGIESIDKFIRHAFILQEAWKYKITHLISQSDKVSDFYFYEANFSIPTFCYPIAQATVGVYFTIEVSRVVPEHLPVRVTFTLESLRRVLVPGQILVDDEMLLRVLYAKLEVFKELCF